MRALQTFPFLRLRTFGVLIVLIALIPVLESCRKKTYLSSKAYPQLLNESIQFAKVFSNGVTMVAGPTGIFVRYSDENWVMLNQSEYPEMSFVEFKELKWMIDDQNNIWGASDEEVVKIWEEGFIRITNFTQLTGSPDFELTSDGTLIRADISVAINDNWEWKYPIRMCVWKDKDWVSWFTDMYIPDESFDAIRMVTLDDGRLLFTSSPSYILQNPLDSNSLYDSIARTNISYRLSLHHSLVENNKVTGTTVELYDGAYGVSLVQMDLATGEANTTKLLQNCTEIDEQLYRITGSKVVAARDGVMYIVYELVYSDFYNDEFTFAYLVSYDTKALTCHAIPLTDHGMFDGYFNSQSVNCYAYDIDKGYLLLGRNNGLMVYDVNADLVFKYAEAQLDIEE